ncbi:MAG: Cell division protein FtsA [Alphaproteobacteria bacterium MarineAlpha2_Bin1]|nr:MAG: Cell division protein FtsA [Alphaproteobacteria bacterium MarineAlpha2_Bin1]
MVVSRNKLLSALDVGTSKVCCFIARFINNDDFEIIGIGHQISKGIKGGSVIDMQKTEDSIRGAIDAAEKMAGEKIKETYICFSGAKTSSEILNEEITVTGDLIRNTDLKRVIQQVKPNINNDYEILHELPIGFSIDGTVGIKDPRGMFGSKLGIQTHIISALSGPMNNLRLCAERGHISVNSFALSSYVAGLATMVEDELRLGATLIDMGEGTTSISVFSNNEMIYSTSIPIGGGHITSDIVRGLGTPSVHAERVKTLYGNVFPVPNDDREIIETPSLGDEDSNLNQVPRSILLGIIRPRVEEILEMVREKIEMSGTNVIAGRRVVITGGSSQLQGISELAARVLDKQVRIGKPINIPGLAEATNGPAFSACAGLLLFATRKSIPVIEEVNNLTWSKYKGNNLIKLGKWLFQNF